MIRLHFRRSLEYMLNISNMKCTARIACGVWDLKLLMYGALSY
jgi:hypothetical protein